MLIRVPSGWELPDVFATPEEVFFDRRGFIKSLAAGALSVSAGVIFPQSATLSAVLNKPSSYAYPFPTNNRYVLDRSLTDPKIAARYNNFYEFGSHKEIWKASQALVTQPWIVTLDGLVERTVQIEVDDLIAKMPLEERLYRHRCVEAWSMAVPWSGFPLRALIEFAKPLSSARYVVMESFLDSSVASGQKQFWYPWPYLEGLTIAEATNELAFMATGIYSKPLPTQHGAPLRLAIPWKYGFKSIKSIVRITFSQDRPTTFWTKIQPSEYGFWANVNPDVDHPRWSQATERVLGSGDRIPTLKYNGYGEFVAGLYEDMVGEQLFM